MAKENCKKCAGESATKGAEAFKKLLSAWMEHSPELNDPIQHIIDNARVLGVINSSEHTKLTDSRALILKKSASMAKVLSKTTDDVTSIINVLKKVSESAK